jgi:aminomethyltransferase
VIIRVLHRGHGRVARKLVGLVLDGDEAPPRGTAIAAADRDIGRVTSSTISPSLGGPIALGYVHRDFTTDGTIVSIGGVRAVVTATPFTAHGRAEAPPLRQQHS